MVGGKERKFKALVTENEIVIYCNGDRVRSFMTANRRRQNRTLEQQNHELRLRINYYIEANRRRQERFLLCATKVAPTYRDIDPEFTDLSRSEIIDLLELVDILNSCYENEHNYLDSMVFDPEDEADADNQIMKDYASKHKKIGDL